jgi:predicted dehydrogenase
MAVSSWPEAVPAPGSATRVGFLGAGFIARFHAFMLGLADEPSEIVAVYDPEPGRAEAFADAHGGTPLGSEDAVIAAADAVFVCTWTAEHARLVAKIAQAGKPVFCEKPLAFDAAEAVAMAEQVERAGVVNQVGLVLRYSPAFALAKALVADPEAGQLMSVVFRDDQYIPNQGQYASVWRVDRALAGSGALLEHSIHDLDIIEHVAGPISSVTAQTANLHGHEGIEDNVAVLLGFRDGGLGVLTSVWHDILERPSARHVELFCERLHVVIEDDWFGPVAWRCTGRDEQRLDGDGLIAALHDRGIATPNPDGAFIAAVRDRTPATPAFTDAVRAHRLADAVYRSAADGGQPVQV